MIIDLAVIYTTRLDACRDFYSGLGLDLVPERHGNGPAHYAAALSGGGVLELYPTTRRPATGYLRLGLTAPSSAAVELPTGRHTLIDPDGRTIVLTVPEGPADGSGSEGSGRRGAPDRRVAIMTEETSPGTEPPTAPTGRTAPRADTEGSA
ncbi:hypothetical protein ACFWUZ_11850 [Streptomyces sp. NPDC058646]|uniref:hypothetical protein n=1 Tax=Streptomyces sp. NPDC058646 TaxID=3346574 RepID=UPI00366583B0